ncbi:MAG: tetratricopeptide repeat protein, partial [Candidatus Nanoarchaeia archaeon]
SFSMRFPILNGWDDHIYIGDGTQLQFSLKNILYWFSHPCEGCYLPLTMLTYMFDYFFWGLNGTGYHIQNIFWHLVAVLFVYRCMLFFGINSWTAFLLTSAFAIHPQRVESVVWISERKDVLCAALYFASFFYFISRKEKDKFPGKSFLLFILAMLSKPMAISLPLVLFLHEIFIADRRDFKILFKNLAPFFILMFIFIPVTIYMQIIPEAKFSIARQIVVILHNIMWYFHKTILPKQLSPIYPRVIFGIPLLLNVFATIIFFAMLIFFMRRAEPLLFKRAGLPFLLCYLVSLAPVSGFFALGAIDYADRYSYIPSVFIWFIIGVYLTVYFHLKPAGAEQDKSQRIYHRPIFSIVVGSIYVFLLALMTIFYSGFWTSYHSVLKAAVMHHPPSFIALGALADLEMLKGNFNEAERLANQILSREKGWETEEGYHRILLKAECIKAVCMYKTGRKKEALPIFEMLAKKMDQNFFTDETNYKNFLNMLDDCKKHAMP